MLGNLLGNFNPRSREGSDISPVNLLEEFDISIRAPARGATLLHCTVSFFTVDFNPRSREGSDCQLGFGFRSR